MPFKLIPGRIKKLFELRSVLGSFESVKAGHKVLSYAASLYDDPAANNVKALLPLLLESAYCAQNISIAENPGKGDSQFYNLFPGEHYKLLAGLVKKRRPKLILDVGTFTGMSARIFLDFSTDFGGTVHTFDVIPWSSFDSHLNQNDFTSKRLFQHLVDLSVPEIFEKYRALFAAADLIFCDAPKDGIFEYKLLRLISNASLPAKERLLVLDDIRFLNMFPLWRSIDSPKLDATSLGHWSGTGLVDISEGLSIKEE